MTYQILLNFWGSQTGPNRARKCGALLLAAVILTFILPIDADTEADIVTVVGYRLSDAIILMLVTGGFARKFWPWAKAKTLPPSIATCLFAAAAFVPLFSTSLLYDWLFTENPDANWLGALATYNAVDYIIWAGFVYMIALLFTGSLSLAAVKFAHPEQDEINQKDSGPQPSRVGQKFLNRLSSNLGTDLICLRMEDHYIRVYTVAGNELIHMRMADAVAELKDYDGFQVHRSWWIAAKAIKNITKEQRRYTAHMNNGLEAPIARNRVESLKEANLL